MLFRNSRKPDRAGSVVVMVAVSLIMILGFTAIALEGGNLIETRRKAQAVADAAALAAAADLYEKYSSNAGVPNSASRTAATNSASANGCANENTGLAGTSKVEVRDNLTSPNTYKGGANAGAVIPAGYVEVTVTIYLARYFSSIWGSAVLPVEARAGARGQHSVFADGVICLSPSASPALKTNGTGVVTVKNGDIIVDSTAAGDIVTTGGATITVTGGKNIYASGPSTSASGATPSPILNVPPTPDPLAFLPEPVRPSTAGTQTSTAMTPGYFVGTPPDKVTGGSVTMAPGLYYFDKGFSVSGSGSVTGAGVTIFNAGTGASQGISITGNGTFNLSPATTGAYAGITIFQARASDAPLKIAGNGTTNIRGTMYVAGADAAVEGNGGVSDSGQVIALTATVGGNGNTTIDFNAPAAPGARIIQLVE